MDGRETRNISFGNDLIIHAIKMKWLTMSFGRFHLLLLDGRLLAATCFFDPFMTLWSSIQSRGTFVSMTTAAGCLKWELCLHYVDPEKTMKTIQA